MNHRNPEQARSGFLFLRGKDHRPDTNVQAEGLSRALDQFPKCWPDRLETGEVVVE